jgi:hypothetical protein
MKKASGRTLPLSLPRRWVGDLVAFAQKVPTVMAERTLNVNALAAARLQVANPPSWCALITKAFGLVSARMPEFRLSFLGFPYPRLYEHPCSVAAIAINRRYGDESAVFLGLMQAPETLPLQEVNRRVRHFVESPVEEIGCYRRLIRTAKLPLPLRRILWWYGLNGRGKIRSKTFGTFCVNSVGSFDLRITQCLTPITTMIYYRSPGPRGELAIQAAFDHRVFDAIIIHLGLTELEKFLNNEMVVEVTKSNNKLDL